MVMSIVTPLIVMGVVGALSGVMLSFADKFMAVPVDERVSDVREMLPGANCGACGFAGCDEYAEKLVNEGVKTNLCTPGGSDTAQKISAYLGADFEGVVEKFALVRCSGTTENTGYLMDYDGPKTCEACSMLYNGHRSCSHACLGFGDCIHVCQYDAIYLKDGIAHVDPELCTACGMCAEACPNALITILPKTNKVYVGCHSTDRGAVTRKVCKVGCIGCKICEKKCGFKAITVTNNLAAIDPEKCTNCGDCVAACPTKAIHQM